MPTKKHKAAPVEPAQVPAESESEVAETEPTIAVPESLFDQLEAGLDQLNELQASLAKAKSDATHYRMAWNRAQSAPRRH